MRNRLRVHRGFTLIELLVVVAIIVVLAAILLPVFARAKDSGYKASAITQARQLGIALQQYVEAADNKYLPSTNYGIADGSVTRIWPSGLYPYVKSKTLFVAPGSDGKYPETYDERSLMTVGYSSATAVDPDKGCKEGLEDTSLCIAFTTVASFDKNDSPSVTGLFALTPGGPLDEGYRGYEFSPYNGTPNLAKPSLSPPLASDRDLVKEMKGTQPSLIKPIYARYGSTGNDDGVTPVVFADFHAKAFSAKSITSMESGIVWRFR